ncbi:hypothetical protein, partial [Candidatus Ruminimicrobium bovinum]|uniref:hypothetical protein n=1 Tax=Candidatus Ruminimicrobium bovinum TaxID=3242779 RepID=UPI0039B91D8C
YTTQHPMHLTSIPPFDLRNAINLEDAFGNNLGITEVPEIDAPKATDIRHIFMNCVNVESGAYAQYLRFSGQAKPPAQYDKAFLNCGSDTESGRAELQQIPASWGGTAE